MRNRLLRTALTGILSLSLAASSLALTTSAESVDVPNGLFETDYWEDGGAWTVEANWDGGATVTQPAYDEWTTVPESGSTKGIDFWDPNGGTGTASQTIKIPAGSYSIKIIGMGENASFRVSYGDNASGAIDVSAWNDWKSTTLNGTSDGSEDTLTVTVDMAAGGYCYIDSVSIEVEPSGDSGDTTESKAEETKTEESKAEESKASTESKADTTTESKAAESSAPERKNGEHTVTNKVENGDFETLSETELVGWTVDWNDLKIWYANDEEKSGRKDLDNDYLNIWAENAGKLSVKQTVHFAAGEYKIAFNMDANDGADTKVKVKVGSFVDYTLPKGTGWEKWAAVETPVFKVDKEGDYDIEFYGDLDAQTWLCLDNVKVVNSDGTNAAADASKSSNSTAGSNSSAAASDANAETGATGGLALALIAVAGAGMVAAKRKEDK